VGHCCESGDLLTPAYNEPNVLAPRTLSRAAIGDLVVIDGAGAYCSSMSAKNYNSFPEAPEVIVRTDGDVRVIRRYENQYPPSMRMPNFLMQTSINGSNCSK
jgi:diaminopimelate decarboxylase